MATMDPAALASMGLLPGGVGVGMSVPGQQAYEYISPSSMQQAGFISAAQYSGQLVPPAYMPSVSGMPQAVSTGGMPSLSAIQSGVGVGVNVGVGVGVPSLLGPDMYGTATTLGQPGLGMGMGMGMGAPFGGAPPMEQLGDAMAYTQLAPPPPLMQQQQQQQQTHYNPRQRGQGRNQKR